MTIRDLIREELGSEPSYKWIRFELANDTGKTKAYNVIAKEGSVYLGQVKWFPSWRKYAFFPSSLTVFETDCLKDIASFLDRLMNDRRIKKNS